MDPAWAAQYANPLQEQLHDVVAQLVDPTQRHGMLAQLADLQLAELKRRKLTQQEGAKAQQEGSKARQEGSKAQHADLKPQPSTLQVPSA